MIIKGQMQRWNPEFDFELTYYLAGPMSGYEDYNYPAFENAAQILRQTGVKIESPHENPWPENYEAMGESKLWIEMMAITHRQMQKCHGIILLKGWPQSRGARIELQEALLKNQPVWFYHNFQLTNMNRSLT